MKTIILNFFTWMRSFFSTKSDRELLKKVREENKKEQEFLDHLGQKFGKDKFEHLMSTKGQSGDGYLEDVSEKKSRLEAELRASAILMNEHNDKEHEFRKRLNKHLPEVELMKLEANKIKSNDDRKLKLQEKYNETNKQTNGTNSRRNQETD